jgi:hypothetical protein
MPPSLRTASMTHASMSARLGFFLFIWVVLMATAIRRELTLAS